MASECALALVTMARKQSSLPGIKWVRIATFQSGAEGKITLLVRAEAG